VGAGCEEAGEYGAFASNLIRGISGSFQLQSLYDRSLRGHIDIREPQGRAQIRRMNEE